MEEISSPQHPRVYTAYSHRADLRLLLRVLVQVYPRLMSAIKSIRTLLWVKCGSRFSRLSKLRASPRYPCSICEYLRCADHHEAESLLSKVAPFSLAASQRPCT
jgi:hypothetical protein